MLRLCTRFVAQTILYQGKARSPRISPQASLSAFVNPCCCQSLASRRYREALCSLSPIALFINNSSCQTCSFLSFSLHFSLFLPSFSLCLLCLSLHSLRFARGKGSFVSRLSRENERKGFRSNALASTFITARDSCSFALAMVSIGKRQCSFPIGTLIVY